MNKVKDTYTKGELFKKTVPFILKEWKLVIVTIFLSVGTALLNTVTPLITKEIIDVHIPAKDMESIIKYLVIFGVITVLMVLMRYFLQYFQTLTGMNIERNVREKAIRKIDYLPVDYYSLEPDGKIVAKITSDSNGVRTFYMTMYSIMNALVNIVSVYVARGSLFYLL